MRIALQYALLVIYALATLGLIVRLYVNARSAKLNKRTLAATLLGILVFSWVGYRMASLLFVAPVVRVGMDFDQARLMLLQQGAKQSYFDVLPTSGQINFYWLSTGPTIRIQSEIGRSGRVIESMAVSTYRPSSWGAKGNPEQNLFFDSFVDVAEYNLRSKPADDNAGQADALSPYKGRDMSSTDRIVIDGILFGVLAFVCVLGLVAGVLASDASIRRIRRVLLVVVGLFAIIDIATFYWAFNATTNHQEASAGVYVFVMVSASLLALAAISASFVGAALIFRPGHRQTGFDMICIGLLPIFVVLIGKVI